MKKITIFLFLATLGLTLAFGSNAGIKVLYPNGGEVLKTGTAVRVKWTPADSKGKVILVLYKKGIKHSVISNGTPNNGLFLWKIPPALPEGNDYRIRIRLEDNLSVNDFSDRNFSIKK